MSESMFPTTRRALLTVGVCAALASIAGAPRSARAQADAVRRLVIGYPAGGLADRLGRVVAGVLSEAPSSSFVVDNRPGAGGMLATDLVSRAGADGRLLLLHNVDVLTMDQALKNDPGFDPLSGLVIVAPIARFEYLVAANAKLGLRSLADLTTPVRAQAALFYVDTGPGVRTLFEALKKRYGLNLVGVPYRGLAPAMPDLLEGRVGLAMLDGAAAAAHAATGKVTILGRADAVASHTASKVPSLVEQGAAGLWVDRRFALMAPASTPAATVEQLRKLVTASLRKPSVLAQLEQISFHPIDMEPELFARSVAESVEQYRHLARQAGLL